MADARIEKWIKSAVGRGMNLDRVYGYQCVDVVNDYGNTLFGKWEQTVGRGNAKDKFSIMPSKYWEKIKNDPTSATQTPRRGDVIVWPGWASNPVGHIAVVTSADKNGVNVIQQDGFTNTKPAHTARLPYILGGKLPIGWLRPRLTTVKLATEAEIKAAYTSILERPADANGIKHYKKYTIGFVKADLLASDERKKLLARKAAEAKAKAEAAQKAAEKAAKDAAEAKAKQEALDNAPYLIQENNALLKQILTLLTTLVNKLTSIFK